MADFSHREEPEAHRSPGGRSWRTFAAIAIAIVAIIIIVQNSQTTDVKILFAEISTPLVFALIVAFLLGALIGWLLPRVRGGKH